MKKRELLARLYNAPYWQMKIVEVIHLTRMEFKALRRIFSKTAQLYMIFLLFRHDFGIDIEEYSNAVQNMTFKCFLLSDKMSPYVEPTTDAENRHILRGRPFENDLLRGLLVDQKLGHDATEQK
jgi:hypothetical protein